MKLITQRHICPPIFIAALLTQPKYGNNLNEPLMGEWIKKM
jgi:hypothetical protein